MSKPDTVSNAVNRTVFTPGSEERARESALRERFAKFWASASGEPRSIYDTFVAGSPLVESVKLVAVDDGGVRGWWVQPAAAAPGEAILFIHGGGYVQGSAKAYRGFASQIVSRTNVPAFVLEYPLAPEASIPSGPEAAVAAWRWMTSKGFSRVAVVGDSAGGGLTLVTLQQLAKNPSGLAPMAGVVFSPWTDLSFTGPSMTDPEVQDPLISYEYLKDCARKVLGNRDAKDPLASPLFGNMNGLPPLLVQVGTDEKLRDDSLQFAEKAARAGVRVDLEIYEGMHHVFQLDVEHIQTARNALDRAAAFLRAAFAG